MAISSIGVGSGLPIDQLLSDLRKNENQALSLIQNRQIDAEQRLSAYGKLKSAVSSLGSAAKALNNTDTYDAVKASSSSEAFTAKTAAGTIAGQYAIQINQLATHQSLAAQGVADRTASIGSDGTITIALQNGDSTTIDLSEAGGTSLNDIAKAINSNHEAGLHATIINDGDESTPYRLLLTSRETGTEASVQSISIDGNAELSDLLSFSVDGTGTASGALSHTAAVNAELSINGIAITSGSNVIDDVIEGVSLTLTDTTSGTADTLSITEDLSVASEAVKDFVKAYNTLQDTIRSLTAYDIENNLSSPLTGDGLTRRLQTAFSGALHHMGSGDHIQTLSQLGVTAHASTGQLELDENRLTEALRNHPDDVKSLLSGTTGLSSRIEQVADTYMRTNGLFSVSTESINQSILDIQRQYEITSQRIDARMETYRQQFSQLDTMLAQMNSVSDYLTQQLSMLNNLASNTSN